mgnify:CR=1 FL=1
MLDDSDLEISVCWPLVEVAAGDEEREDTNTLCDRLLMEHCDANDLDSKDIQRS